MDERPSDSCHLGVRISHPRNAWGDWRFNFERLSIVRLSNQFYDETIGFLYQFYAEINNEILLLLVIEPHLCLLGLAARSSEVSFSQFDDGWTFRIVSGFKAIAPRLTWHFPILSRDDRHSLKTLWPEPLSSVVTGRALHSPRFCIGQISVIHGSSDPPAVLKYHIYHIFVYVSQFLSSEN
jgi:hypothetical protein